MASLIALKITSIVIWNRPRQTKWLKVVENISGATYIFDTVFSRWCFRRGLIWADCQRP